MKEDQHLAGMGHSADFLYDFFPVPSSFQHTLQNPVTRYPFRDVRLQISLCWCDGIPSLHSELFAHRVIIP
jgi:hypothetical protein